MAPKLLAGPVREPGALVGDARPRAQLDDLRCARMQAPERVAVSSQAIAEGSGRRPGRRTVLAGIMSPRRMLSGCRLRRARLCVLDRTSLACSSYGNRRREARAAADARVRWLRSHSRSLEFAADRGRDTIARGH